MALTQISTAGVKDDAVTAGKIPANAVGSSELADNAVDNAAVASNAAINATKLSYTQSDTGASARTVDSKLEDFVSVKDFGAAGDGSTNDATAFASALATEKAIYVPAGTYVIGSTLTISDKNVTLIGEGERLSILKFTGGTDGLNWTSSDDSHSLILEKLQFQASATMSGSPVDANFGVTSGSIRAGVSLENIVAAPTGSGAWTEGFRFNNCRNSNIVECIFNGVLATSTYGYKFTGQCLDVKAERCQANDINAGSGQAFIVEGTCEGVQISGALVINTKIGVDHATPNMEPYLSVLGSHFNTRQFGIRISKSEQSIISNNLFYADTENPSACENYIGVELLANADNDFNSITDNIFHASRTNSGSAVTEIGIRMQHGDSNIVANNVFKVFDTGIQIDAAATNTQLSDNRYSSVTTEENFGDTTVVSLKASGNRYIVGGHGNKDVQLELKSGTDGFKFSNFSDGSAGIESTNNNNIRFFTNGEKLRIQSGGGISFNGDTAAANALSDYEEGTWNPLWSDAMSGGTTSTNNMFGTYTKIGRIVHAHFFTWGLPTTGNSNNMYLQGLPFAMANVNSMGATYAPVQSAFYNMGADNYYSLGLRLTNGNTAAPLKFSHVSSADGVHATFQGFINYYTNFYGCVTYTAV